MTQSVVVEKPSYRRPRLRIAAKVATLMGACIMLSGCFSTFFAANEPEITLKNTMPQVDNARSAWSYLEEGAYDNAIPAFRLALTKDPQNEHLLFGLAESSRYAGYIEQAEAQYSKLLDTPEYRADALTGIGLVKLASFDTDGAYEMFSAAVEENEAAWRAWLGLAQLRDLANDWENADKAYAKALALSDNRALVLNNHGVSMMAREQYDQALAYFDMAAAIAPDSSRIDTNIDLARAAAKDYEAGGDLKHFEAKTRAAKLNNRGYAAMLRGDDAAAEIFFEQAIDAHPSFYAVAHKNLQALRSRTASTH